MRLWLCYDVCHCEVHFPWAQATWIGECLGVRRRTTAFTCRAGCKERDVSKKRNAGPVKCNALFASSVCSQCAGYQKGQLHRPHCPRRHPPSPQPPLLSDTEVAWTCRQSRQWYVMG